MHFWRKESKLEKMHEKEKKVQISSSFAEQLSKIYVEIMTERSY